MAVRRKRNVKKPAPTPGTKSARKGRVHSQKKQISQKLWAETVEKLMAKAPATLSPGQQVNWVSKKMRENYRLQTRRRT